MVRHPDCRRSLDGANGESGPGVSISVDGTIEDAARLRLPETIRSKCSSLLVRARRGESDVFTVVDARIEPTVSYVLDVMRSRVPAPDTPVHGRMRHFDAGGRTRSRDLADRIASLPPEERARVKIDLVVPSVLLDAGAGPTWSYDDEGQRLGRSEGLAVASFRMFMRGEFAADGVSLRTDAEGLSRMDASRLGRSFQVTPDNPIVGLEGRAHVLVELSRALRRDEERFGAAGRPGHLFDWVKRRAKSGRIEACVLLGALLDGLSSIWPGRLVLAGEPLGDVWPHPALGVGVDSLVPFHKLSQWLTYSLVEPMLDGGIEVVGLERLTRLPEYRNGGLLIDLGALALRDERARERTYHVHDPLVVEWRALTVALLDEIVPRVQERLPRHPAVVGMASALESGTWLAGRLAARRARPDGTPPLAIASDGTVF